MARSKKRPRPGKRIPRPRRGLKRAFPAKRISKPRMPGLRRARRGRVRRRPR